MLEKFTYFHTMLFLTMFCHSVLSHILIIAIPRVIKKVVNYTVKIFVDNQAAIRSIDSLVCKTKLVKYFSHALARFLDFHFNEDHPEFIFLKENFYLFNIFYEEFSINADFDIGNLLEELEENTYFIISKL